MLVELKAKSQVTIPKEVVDNLHLEQGSQLQVSIVNGRIILTPVVVYPEHVIKELKQSITEVRDAIDRGEQPLFDSVEGLFEALDKP